MAASHSSLPLKPNVDYRWCNSDIKKIQFGYVWSIKRFSYLQEQNREFIKSSVFSASGDDIHKWHLELYPRGCNELSKDCVSLFLCYTSDTQSRGVNVGFELSILNNKREKTNVRKVDFHMFQMGGRDTRDWGYQGFVRRQNLTCTENGLLSNDELTICCEMAILKKRTNTEGSISAFAPSTTETRVTEDLGHLLESRDFSDVVLVAQGREIRCHKAILAARSPVFAAMLAHDMKERRENAVEISDIDHGVLQQMIRFIYTGKVPVMDDALATGLLVSADKYGLVGLKENCERSLAVVLTPEKVVDLIPLASLHSANHLKAKVIDFMKYCATDDVIDGLWDDLISHYPQVVIDAFSRASAK